MQKSKSSLSASHPRPTIIECAFEQTSPQSATLESKTTVSRPLKVEVFDRLSVPVLCNVLCANGKVKNVTTDWSRAVIPQLHVEMIARKDTEMVPSDVTDQPDQFTLECLENKYRKDFIFIDDTTSYIVHTDALGVDMEEHHSAVGIDIARATEYARLPVQLFFRGIRWDKPRLDRLA